MAKSSADDEELRRACEAAIEGTKQKIVMSIRVAKGRGMWGKSGKLGRNMAKPRVLALSSTLIFFSSYQIWFHCSDLFSFSIVFAFLVREMFYCILTIDVLMMTWISSISSNSRNVKLPGHAFEILMKLDSVRIQLDFIPC